MVVFDSLDFFILNKIYFTKPETTTWNITKEYFKSKDNNLLRAKNNLIIYRLEQMSKIGLIHIERNGNREKIYTLDLEKIVYKKHKFPNGYKNAVLININKWIIFEL